MSEQEMRAQLPNLVSQRALAQRQSRFSWHRGLCEAVDNSLDAGANSVTVVFPSNKAGRLTILDDGSGASERALIAMVTEGDHYEERKTKRIGIYGVGLKDFAQWASCETSIVSCHEDVIRRVGIDWENNDGTYHAVREARSYEARLLVGGRGTCVSLNRIVQAVPRIDTIHNLADKLREDFLPALRAGRQIALKRIDQRGHVQLVALLAPRETPQLEDMREAVIENQSGTKRVRVVAGLLRPGASVEAGVYISYLYRTMEKHSAWGLADMPRGNFYAEVMLDEDCHWRLSRHKDGVSPEETDDWRYIESQFHIKFRDLIECAKEKSVRLSMSRVQIRANEIMGDIFGKPKRFRREEPDKEPREKKETPRRVRKAEHVAENEGDARAKGRRGAPVVHFDEIPRDTLLDIDVRRNRITFNTRHWWVAQVRREEGKARGELLGLMMYGVRDFLAEGLRLDGDQFRLQLDGDTIAEKMWSLIPERGSITIEEMK